jgi:septum formation protein
MAQSRALVLASGSAYRKALLQRLGMPFQTFSPDIDESPLDGEAPRDTALRLSVLKAKAGARAYPDALIIGSDQVAAANGRVYGKSGNFENAVRQLRELSGKAVDFFTAVTLLDKDKHESRLVPCRVTFRALDEQRIQSYLTKEKPYDCAGAAKAEGLGIALIARIETEDPTSLIGLPLIALSEMLERAGLRVV